MDQLKVILAHRFWILSVLAVLIPPIGWWMSTGDMATKTDARTKAIDSKVKLIQGLTQKLSTQANAEWIDGVKQANEQLTRRVAETQKALYDHQRAVMVMHPLVDSELKQAHVNYRGENGTDPQAFARAKRRFISRYIDQWQHVVETVEPFHTLTGSGKVWCSQGSSAAQITRAPVETWKANNDMIGTTEFWDSQEDLWMLQALFKAVARVNEGSTSIDDARIKQLMVATLRGGSQTDLDDRRKGKGPAQQNSIRPAGSPMFPGFGTGPSGGDSMPQLVPMIEPDDIFGSDDSSQMQQQSSTPQGKTRGAAVEPTPARRYADLGAQGTWRSRGFVLRVVMDHQEIPKLLTALSDSPFPVQIYQVENIPIDFSKTRPQLASDATPTGGDAEIDQKRMKQIEDRLKLALNQAYLADVLIAGTFTLYDEPSAPAGQPAASPSPVPAGAPQASKVAAGASTPPTNAMPAQSATSGPGTGAPTGSGPGAVPQSASPGKTATPTGPAGSGPQAPKSNSTPSSVIPNSTAPKPTAPKPAQPVKS